MGCTASSENDDDLEDFLGICKYTHPGVVMSKSINLANKVFIIVISGEITVHLSFGEKPLPSGGQRLLGRGMSNMLTGLDETDDSSLSILARTYYPGGIIHLFPDSHDQNHSSVDGSIKIGKFKLQFSTKNTIRKSSYVTIDSDDLNRFICEKSNGLYGQPELSALQQLAAAKISKYCGSCFEFKGLSKSELDVLGPLLLIKLTRTKDVLVRSDSARIPAISSKDDSAKSKSKLNAENENRGIILAGHFKILPSGEQPDDYFAKLPQSSTSSICFNRNDSLMLGVKPLDNMFKFSFSKKIFPESPSYRRNSKSNSNALVNTMSRMFSRKFPVNKANIVDPKTVEPGNYLPIGGLIGAESLFLRDYYGMATVVCCEGDGLVGTISRQVIDCIRKICKSTFDVLYRNFAEELICSVSETVSLFHDLTEADRAILASKVDVVSVPAGENICTFGQKSQHLFVIIKGAVEEMYESLDAVTGQTCSELGGIYFSGQFFGEQALITDMPSPSTITCIESCVLLAIDDEAYKAVFASKQRLAEAEIKLAGDRVELKYIVMHPEGFILIQNFVAMERASENLNFYMSCETLEDMCKLLLKKSKQASLSSRRFRTASTDASEVAGVSKSEKHAVVIAVQDIPPSPIVDNAMVDIDNSSESSPLSPPVITKKLITRNGILPPIFNPSPLAAIVVPSSLSVATSESDVKSSDVDNSASPRHSMFNSPKQTWRATSIKYYRQQSHSGCTDSNKTHQDDSNRIDDSNTFATDAMGANVTKNECNANSDILQGRISSNSLPGPSVQVPAYSSPSVMSLHPPGSVSYLTGMIDSDSLSPAITEPSAVEDTSQIPFGKAAMIRTHSARLKLLQQSGESGEMLIVSSNIRSVRDYLQGIVDKHLAPSAEEEINIPGSMREEFLMQFETWSVTTKILVNKASSVRSTEQDILLYRREEMKAIQEGLEMVTSAKLEIYNLLKKDTFPRFKRSKEFQEFIAKIKPFEKQEPLTMREYITMRRVSAPNHVALTSSR